MLRPRPAAALMLASRSLTLMVDPCVAVSVRSFVATAGKVKREEGLASFWAECGGSSRWGSDGSRDDCAGSCRLDLPGRRAGVGAEPVARNAARTAATASAAASRRAIFSSVAVGAATEDRWATREDALVLRQSRWKRQSSRAALCGLAGVYM